MRYLDREQREKVGYTYVIDNLDIQSPYGRKALLKLTPYLKGDEDKLREEHNRLQEIEEAMENRKASIKIENLLMRLKDIENSCISCEKGKLLDDIELYEIKIQTMVIEEIKEILEELGIQGFPLNSMERIISLLDPSGDKIPTYYIYDEYSENLREIRYRKKVIEKKIYEAESVEERNSLREERLGIVVEESDEELEIRKWLSRRLELKIEELLFNIKLIGRLDLTMGKARFNKKYGWKKPSISTENKLIGNELINLKVKHMVEKKGQSYTPINIELSRGTTIITGANMGGKTVALKTITLNIFLFQMGFYPMGKNISMPLFDFIDFISDDHQDVSKGLSTFGAEMIRIKEVMVFLKNGNGFVALDEFARGTNPYEGQKLARSLAEYLEKFDSIGVMATHYDGVVAKEMAHYQVVGLKGIDFERLKRKVDLNKKQSVGILQEYMDYSLERCRGYEVPKDALNIAMLLGVEEDFIEYILKNYREDI